MRSARRAPVLILALASLCLPLQATSCAVPGFRNDRFGLAACPPPTFVFPTDIRDGPYHLAQEPREIGWGSVGIDSSFATYAFTDINASGVGPRPVALRLVRGTTCSLDVLREARPDSLSKEESAAIARAAAARAGTQSLEPALSERVRAKDLLGWVTRTAKHSTPTSIDVTGAAVRRYAIAQR